MAENKEHIIGNNEEIAEEFGVFRTMSERDFFTFHLLEKARQEKEKKQKEKDEREV